MNARWLKILLPVSAVLLAASPGVLGESPSTATAPDSLVAHNWKWSVSVKKAMLQPEESQSGAFRLDKKKANRAAEKFCVQLQKEISKASRATFYDNVPTAGRVVVTLFLNPDVRWNVKQPAVDDRSSRTIDAAKDRIPPPSGDEGISDSRLNLGVSQKAGDYRVAQATIELHLSNDSIAVSMKAPLDSYGNPDIEKLAKMLAPDMERIAAASRSK